MGIGVGSLTAIEASLCRGPEKMEVVELARIQVTMEELLLRSEHSTVLLC